MQINKWKAKVNGRQTFFSRICVIKPADIDGLQEYITHHKSKAPAVRLTQDLKKPEVAQRDPEMVSQNPPPCRDPEMVSQKLCRNLFLRNLRDT